MSIPAKRKIATVGGDGHIRLIEQPIPELQDGTVLVQVYASLVSPGSELRGGWRGLSQMRSKPNPEIKSRPFGYANAGVVRQVGKGVDRFNVGDRVCCMGGGYACHTDYAVAPHHLCVLLPKAVTFAQGAYGHLAATAMHALRRNSPQFGEYVAIVGLGLVGQLAAQFHKLSGCYVIGWDMINTRLEIAQRSGLDALVNTAVQDAPEATGLFTSGYGLDSAVMAFGGDGTDAFNTLQSCMKQAPDGPRNGRIVVVGKTTFNYNAATFNIDIRRSARTGPGYHDPQWEYGPDYPSVYMRWTTRTNLELCMRLISEGKLNVDALTTHTISLENVDQEISQILDEPDSILGVVFQCQRGDKTV